MNTSTKGCAIERKAKELLVSEGYLVHRTVRTPFAVPGKGCMASHNNDVFGVFDLVATCPDDMMFIQVTTVGEINRRMAKVEPVAEHFPSSVIVEVWGWVGGRKRYDKRYKDRKIFCRRQYYKRMRLALGGWYDVTPEDDGWQDTQHVIDG